MNIAKRTRFILVICCVIWSGAVGVGLFCLWYYENSPGNAGEAPMVWPSNSSLPASTGQATLLMFVHPQCPCTRASIGELALIMARCQGKASASVLFIKPAGSSDHLEQGGLWRAAAAIPGVRVAADEDGVEARRFGAATSGQTLLYSPDGRLMFSGGITGSRGHSGDNAGRSAILARLNGEMAARTGTFVFGCALFDENSSCSPDKTICEH